MKDIIEEWTKKEIRRLSHKKAPPKEEYRVLERRIKAKLRVYVEQQFELAKESIDKDFEGEGVFQIEMLGIDTYDPDFGLCCPYFEISREAIRERVFSPMITPILELIQAQVSEFDSVQGKLGLKLRVCPFDQDEKYVLSLEQNLFFVGGASSNGYIRKRIQDHFKSLTMLPRHDNSATLVADGSLIRYLRRDAIKTTSVSRSFGVVWDEEYEKDTHGSDVKLHRDKFDQKYVVRDCITWIFRRVFEINFYLDRRLSLQGEHIPSGEERFMPKGAWHAVPITGLQRLRQNLYQSKTQTKDHVPLSSPKSGIRQIGYVEIVLSTKDRKDFQVISRGKKKWHLFDYTMRMKYDHSVMEYEFIIPKNGCGECNENWEESNGAKVMAARLEPDICFDWQEQESASTQPPSGCASDQVANRPPTNNSATANYIYNDISGRRDQPQIDVNQSTNLKRKQKHMKDLTHKRTRHSDLNHHGADHTPYSSPLPKKAPSKRLITPDIHPHERSPASRARGNPRKAIQTSAPMAIMSELHNNKRRRGTSIYDFEDSSEYWSDENAETGPNQPPVDVWSFWPENA
ncbi:uncharacterized protein KY384_007914 [Bacidia gigantensis]|uniref:uncharacterized protein n=1 Tax=Bacidia gigantensis TaxID=2732470 RepID=UPI001D03BBFC|nr:uncharacterized protein KY384_007914 [Bacidia gigantensis]KAG8527760.1 hypothetical protein KY384_007914 [Bacidia gigantensis]